MLSDIKLKEGKTINFCGFDSINKIQLLYVSIYVSANLNSKLLIIKVILKFRTIMDSGSQSSQNGANDDLTYHLLLAELIQKDPTMQRQLRRIKGQSTECVQNAEANANQKLAELVKQGKFSIHLFPDCI